MKTNRIANAALICGLAVLLVLGGILLTPTQTSYAQTGDSGCLECHDGISDIREFYRNDVRFLRQF